jgi:hypothetical protein
MCYKGVTGREWGLWDGAGCHRRGATRQHASDRDSRGARHLQSAGVRAKDQELHHPGGSQPGGHRAHLAQHRLLPDRTPPGKVALGVCVCYHPSGFLKNIFVDFLGCGWVMGLAGLSGDWDWDVWVWEHYCGRGGFHC